MKLVFFLVKFLLFAEKQNHFELTRDKSRIYYMNQSCVMKLKGSYTHTHKCLQLRNRKSPSTQASSILVSLGFSTPPLTERLLDLFLSLDCFICFPVHMLKDSFLIPSQFDHQARLFSGLVL